MRFISHIIDSLRKFAPDRKYLLMILVLCSGYAFAAETTQDSDVIEAIVQVLNFVFTVITFLLTPAVILAGWLLSPDWTMGDFFGLRPYFIQVWVLVSNLVYIIFALMLLWMAIMQIFSSESNYAFKNKLPHFLVGIMIVPFTWLLVSWTLSFANQAVAAVLSIPSGAIASMNKGDTGVFHLRTIPTEFTLNFAEDAPGANAETVSCTDLGETKSGGVKCISPAEFISRNSSGPFFIIMVYAYDIFKIQKTEMINFAEVCKGVGDAEQGQQNSATCVSDLAKLLRKFGVAFITTTFFAIILIALCWVLLARAFKLWIYVMFSPLFGLAYAVSDGELSKEFNSGGGGGHGEGMSLGEVGFKPFFSLAMVPVMVSAVLSFGLLFIGVINNTFTSGSLADNGSGTFCTTGEFMVKYCIEQTGTDKGYSSYIIIGNEGATVGEGSDERNAFIKFNFGSMLSEFVGNSAGNTAVGATQGFVDGANDIFAHIILSLIALAVMWMGVKAAVSHDEVTKAAFAPFEKFGNSVGNFVQHIPSYLPTPHPAFAAFTPTGMEAIATALQTRINTEKAQNAKSLGEILNDPSILKFSSDVSAAGSDIKQAANVIDQATDRQLSSVQGFEKVQPTLVNGIKAAATLQLDANAAQNASLQKQAKDLAASLERATNTAEVKTILSENRTVVEAIKKADPDGAGKIIRKFESSKVSSAGDSNAAFTPTSVGSSGAVNGNGVASVSFDSSGKATIGGDLTPAQKEAIRGKKTELISGNPETQREALTQLGFTVDQSRVGAFANALVEKAGV